MSKIERIKALNEEELKHNISGRQSWHYTYKDSCYIYIGNIDTRLTEGDLLAVFSQVLPLGGRGGLWGWWREEPWWGGWREES